MALHQFLTDAVVALALGLLIAGPAVLVLWWRR